MKYWRKEKNQIIKRISNAEDRWDNFPETIWNLLYTDEHRYYMENLKSCLEAKEMNKVYKYPVTRIQVLLSEKNICSSDEIPGLAVLEVEVPEEETGKEFKIDVEKVYQYLAKNQLIPGLKIDDEEAKRHSGKSEGYKLQKSMWKKNIKPFTFTMNIIDYFDSLDTPNNMALPS